MIFKVYWENGKGERHMGFVNAQNRYKAQKITEDRLQEGYVVTGVYNGTLDQVTPQSITLNFPNKSEYTAFG